jgi:hypothetical protein
MKNTMTHLMNKNMRMIMSLNYFSYLIYYFSNTILPKNWVYYTSDIVKDSSDVPMYDEIAIKPAHMKTAADWAYMQKTYGVKPPATTSKPPARQTTTTAKPPVRQTVNTTQGKVTGVVRPNQIELLVLDIRQAVKSGAAGGNFFAGVGIGLNACHAKKALVFGGNFFAKAGVVLCGGFAHEPRVFGGLFIAVFSPCSVQNQGRSQKYPMPFFNHSFAHLKVETES